ncbi:MAG: PTS lactose/cellobiose transporter subunit IIA [Mycoplasmoidaceae bacterium]
MSKKLTKEDVTKLGLELVALAGEARCLYLEALNEAKARNFNKIDPLLKEAGELITECHVKQTEMLQAEARGEYCDATLIMIHGQDHLMTTILLKELVSHIVDLYKGQK